MFLLTKIKVFRECDGFGHIQSKCANNLKKKEAINTSWHDEDSKDSQNDEEDLLCKVVFAGYLSTNVCFHGQEKTNHMLQQKLFIVTIIQC